MSDTIIKFDSVYKSYKIHERGYRSFRGEFTNWMKRVAQSAMLPAQNDDYLWALKDVSFEVKKGKALGIIGANGSGKTTILRLLAKVTTPTKGNIDVTGKVAPLIQVGAGFHPELTGKENVYLNATIMGLSKKEIDDKYDDIVAFAELDRFMDTPVKRYSSGMYVRLGFAIVANIDPDIFLIDEILSVGDLSFQRKCLSTMEKIRKSDKGIVFISHNLSAVKGLCDRVIWLNKGEIQKEGNPDGVINAYTSYMTSQSQFVGDTSYVDGKTRWGTGEIKLTKIEILSNKYKEFQSCFVGDPMIVRLNYKALKVINNPVFYIGILNMNEVWITGSTLSRQTMGEEFIVEGEGVLECYFESLMIQPGNYCLQVGVYDVFGSMAYDRIGGIKNFKVLDKVFDNIESYRGYEWQGVVRIPNKWKVV